MSNRVSGAILTHPIFLDVAGARTSLAFAALLRERCDMIKEQRIELMSAAVIKLEEAAQLLAEAEEKVLADRVEELADLVDVVATPCDEVEATVVNGQPGD